MKCSTLECHSEAVATTLVGGNPKCIECSIKMTKVSGPDAVVTIVGGKFPWDYPADGICGNCGVPYNKFLIGHTGDCPNCRRNTVDIGDNNEGILP
jgi:Zn finger protein HypA/HybF involved in hydrogenase expression